MIWRTTDTLDVVGSNGVDNFTISATSVTVETLTINYSGIELLTAKGDGGNDVFAVTSSADTQITIDGENGNDDSLTLAGEGLGVVLEQRKVTLDGRQPVVWTNTTDTF